MANDSTHAGASTIHDTSTTDDAYFANDMQGEDVFFGPEQLAQANAEKVVPVPPDQNVIRVQVNPGEIIELSSPFDPGATLLAREGDGNLAIRVGDVTVILQGYVDANQQAPVVIETSDGKPIDIATLLASTDPTIDIQTAAGPGDNGPQGQGADNTGALLSQFANGNGLGGLNAVGAQDATALKYGLIDNSILLDRNDDLIALAASVGGPAPFPGVSEPFLRDPFKTDTGAWLSFDAFKAEYAQYIDDNKGTKGGWADFTGSQATGDDSATFFLDTSYTVTVPHSSTTPQGLNLLDAAGFFNGAVPSSNGEPLEARYLQASPFDHSTVVLVRPSDGAVVMVFHVMETETTGDFHVEVYLVNRLDHHDQGQDVLSIGFNTELFTPPAEGEESEGTTEPGPAASIAILDDIPVTGETDYYSFTHATNYSDALSCFLAFCGGKITDYVISHDAGHVDEDYIFGGNRDKDNKDGPDSDLDRGDDIGDKFVAGMLNINWGADGPSGKIPEGDKATASDPLWTNANPPALAIKGLAVGETFPGVTSQGHTLVVLKHEQVLGLGIEILEVGYTKDEGPVPAFAKGVKGDDVVVFSLLLQTGANLEIPIVNVNAFGGFLFAQSAPIDHPVGATLETNLLLNFEIEATDDDGDHPIDPVVITIAVNDDAPYFSISYTSEDPKNCAWDDDRGDLRSLTGGDGYGHVDHFTTKDFGYVDEDWLNGALSNDGTPRADGPGNHDRDGFGDDNANLFGDDKGGLEVCGQIKVKYGADGPSDAAGNGKLGLAEYENIDPENPPLFINGDGKSLTSDGKDLVVLSSSATHLLVGIAAYDIPGEVIKHVDEQWVFCLDLDPCTGKFEFHLLGAIDHVPATVNGDPESSLVLTFDVGFAEDYDLDKVIGQINIKVNDDKPEVGITYCNEDPGSYTTFAFGGAIHHDTDFGRIDEDWLKGAVTNDGYTYYVPIGNQDRDYFYNDNANKFGDDYGSDHLSGQINMDYGADGEGARTLTLAGFSGDFKDADNNQLFSDGHKLEVLTSEIGLLEIGYKVGNVETIVFTLELDQNGHFDFTQKMPIDHPIESPIEDNVYLAIKAASITDGDGDTVDAVIKIQVNDDVPETGITYDSGDPKARSEAIITYGAPFVDYGQIDEDFLPLSGNQDHDNSTWGSPSDPDRGDEAGGLFVTGTLGGTHYGADGPDGTPSHAFVLSGLGKDDPFLDADGKQVESHGNPLVVINSTGSLLEVGYGTTVVFTLTMTSDTEFEFELKGPLDQVNTPGGKLEDGTVLVFGAEDTGAATDKDGDPAARIVIHVNDDAPMVCEVSYTSFFEITGEDGVATVANATGSGIHGSVDEDQLSTGQGNLDTDNDPSGTHSDVVRGDTIGSNVATGYVAINFGADGPADNAFALDEYKAGDIFYDADGNAYTSHGHILTVLDADADHVYVGYSDNAVDTTVFEIRLDRNAGSFSFNLQAPLDHPNAGTEDDLPVTFNVTATDFDGDSVTTKLSIHVNDDAPAGGTVDYSEAVIFPGTAFGAVDEDYAAGGNEDDDGDAGATDGQGGGSVIATVTVTPFAPGIGADGPADHPYSLAAYAPGTNFTDSNGNTITAKFDDTPLVVISSSDSELVVGHSGGAAVFKVTLDQDSGAATFSLLEGLDNLSGDNDESGDIPLAFAVLARDYDDDTATTTVRIMVNDDRPVGVADTATIDSAGGATGNVLGNDKGGADGLKVVMPVPGETSHIFTGVFGGSLTLHEDGSWSYLADAGRDNETEVQESFNYSIIDGDNDTSAATLTITIPPAEISTRSAPANSVYDDSAYALHIAETGKDVDATDHASYHPGDNVKIEDNSPGGLLQLKGGHDLRGGSGDDLIFGNDGPDDIYGRAGHDAMSGGKGADAFRDVDAADLDGSHTLDGIHSIDGGEGIDTVYLGGLKTFDSSQAEKIENVEVLNFKGDPAGDAGTQVTLNYDAAYGVTQVGGLHSLTIMGDAGKDTVNLVGSSGKSWVHDFDLFGAQVFHAGSGPDDRVTVTVEAGVQVTLS